MRVIMRSLRSWAAVAVLTGGVAGPAGAQQFLDTRLVAGGFTQPLYVTTAPGAASTLYVVERGGLIKTVDRATGTVNPTPFLNMTAPELSATQFLSAGGEQGLLGLAFHPNFQSGSRFIYVNYTWGTGSGNTRVERYTVQANGTVDTGSGQLVMQFDQPFSNHNGGWMGFHPTNGLLYIASGDGGSANDPNNNGQNPNTPLGKILRIDVNGPDAFPGDPNRNFAVPPNNNTLPGSNPNLPPGAPVLPEVYAYGLRNPWRASFDRANGNMYIGDVGQSAREEIDFIPNGAAVTPNFGWRLREGTIPNPTAGIGGDPPPDNVEPIKDHVRAEAASITGGYVYRGPDIPDFNGPLAGTYIYADYIRGRFYSFRYDGTTVTDFQERTAELGIASDGVTVVNEITSFGEDGDGNLYVVDYGFGGFGQIYQIVPVPEPGAVLLLAAPVAVWLARRRVAARRIGA
jgi:glucose/arabinose dehydrogenase